MNGLRKKYRVKQRSDDKRRFKFNHRRTKRRYTGQQICNMLSDYAKGVSSRELAKKHGCTKTMIGWIISGRYYGDVLSPDRIKAKERAKYNLRTKNISKRKLSFIEIALICREYESGKKLEELAQEFGCHWNTILSIVRKRKYQ